MNLLGGLGGLIVVLTWVWFLVFPLAIMAIGLSQVARDTGKAVAAAGAKVPTTVEELRQVICPATGEALEVAVQVVSPAVLRVTRCPRFGDKPVTCAQRCLAG